MSAFAKVRCLLGILYLSYPSWPPFRCKWPELGAYESLQHLWEAWAAGAIQLLCSWRRWKDVPPVSHPNMLCKSPLLGTLSRTEALLFREL